MKIKLAYFWPSIPIVIGMLVFISVMIWVIRDNNCAGCAEKNIGVIKDIIPRPSSFNSKTEIRTEKQFYVVMGFPQLQIGDSLMVRLDKKRIALIRDDTGQWFSVIHNTN